jgi:hypothetical protein
VDATGATLLATGGAAGASSVAYLGTAGRGADGFVRIESATGLVGIPGSSLPAATAGIVDVVSAPADPPSVFTGTWFSTGAVAPRFLPFEEGDFGLAEEGGTVAWEIQAARGDPFRPGHPDTGALDAGGDSADPSRASGWILVRDTAGGIRDVADDLAVGPYEFFRLRLTFTMPAGIGTGDPRPRAESFRVRVRVQE